MFSNAASSEGLFARCFWLDGIASWVFLISVHAVHAAEGDVSLIGKDAVDDSDGFAIDGAFVIDGGTAFGKDGSDADEGEQDGRDECFHGVWIWVVEPVGETAF